MTFGKFLACLVAAVFFLNLRVHSQEPPDYKHLFNYAENLSNAENHNDSTDALALRTYLKVIGILSKTKQDNAFLFGVYVNTGAFLQVLGRQKESISFFKKAIDLKKQLTALKDSVLFRPLVYCGNAYYSIDIPDTAEIFYKTAENVAEKYPDVNELQRLYNTLGVISYSKGNYSESITYYQKAISSLTRHSSYDKSLLVTYKNNLASALKKLKRYDQSLKIYQGLLRYNAETDKLFHNIGSVYLAMDKPGLAIGYLQKVKYDNQKKFNDLGLAWAKEKNYDQAIYYLQKSIDLNSRVNKSHKNSDLGITLKYLGDVWFQRKQISKALTFYQLSIANLLPDFRSADIHANPTSFNSAFNGIELLETLSAKAAAFGVLYTETKNTRDLESSLQTYLTFNKLANYIERFYETDESRLVISDKKYFSRQQPMDICLQLFKLTANRKFIETAFSLDEENKANILSLYLEEANIKTKAGVPAKLLREEINVKEAITSTALKASDETDSVKLVGFKNEVNELTIDLLRTQQKISEKTGFNTSNTSDKRTTISNLQKIIPPESAILSYHISDSTMICFVITSDKFDFFTAKLNSVFFSSIKDLYQMAQQREGNSTKEIRRLGQSLYQQLIKPAEGLIENKKDLMIIPDNELNYLPFELLTNNNEKSLLSEIAITYNYSCNILLNGHDNLAVSTMSKMGMAPFDEKVMSGAGSTSRWPELPASGQEIQALGGKSLFNKNATKQEFLTQAHNFNIIHLATHAYANDMHPEKSYVVFYPANPDSAIYYKLYMPEIYNLRLDRTRLIVLSACESGAGTLAKGEGLMSLSRAFSYSGCDNIITSMWKADDASTAYISARLYFYLQEGFTVAEALRKSKLDYLDNPQFASSKKLAGFWAHLRLTGAFEKRPESHLWVLYVSIFMLAALMLLFIAKGRPNKLRRP